MPTNNVIEMIQQLKFIWVVPSWMFPDPVLFKRMDWMNPHTVRSDLQNEDDDQIYFSNFDSVTVFHISDVLLNAIQTDDPSRFGVNIIETTIN